MDSIRKQLIQYAGFSDKKALIFTSLLQLGECTASDIAKKAGLKRTTVYNILPELLEEGYVKSTRSNKIKKFFIDDPQIILDKAQEKTEAIEKMLPDMHAIFNIINIRPKITVFEGFAGVKKIYDDFLQSTARGSTVLCYAGTKDILTYMPEDFLYGYMDKRLRKNIFMKIISGRNAITQKIKDDAKKQLRDVRISNSKEFDFCGETIIYADKVAFISYKENYLCTLIESKEITMMQRAIFNLAWSQSE